MEIGLMEIINLFPLGIVLIETKIIIITIKLLMKNIATFVTNMAIRWVDVGQDHYALFAEIEDMCLMSVIYLKISASIAMKKVT